MLSEALHSIVVVFPVAQLGEAMKNQDDPGGILIRLGVTIDRVLRSVRPGTETPNTILVFTDRNIPAKQYKEAKVSDTQTEPTENLLVLVLPTLTVNNTTPEINRFLPF